MFMTLGQSTFRMEDVLMIIHNKNNDTARVVFKNAALHLEYDGAKDTQKEAYDTLVAFLAKQPSFKQANELT
jgi:hypothetical protein